MTETTTPSVIRFMPGDGTTQFVEVNYIAYNGARGPDGFCAFCHGDPCAEFSAPDSAIAQYFERARNKYGPDATWYHPPETCPMCNGQAS